MSKRLRVLLSGATAMAAVGVAASEGLLYLLSHKSAELSGLVPINGSDEREIDRDILKKRSDARKWVTLQELSHYHITSDDGLRLHAALLPAKHPSKRYAFCIHGFHCSGIREFDTIARFYYEHDINCFMIDQRSHGDSEGTYITYGVKESDDCIKWLKFMRKEFGDDIEIILHGVSMGAATVMLMSGKMLPNNVVFAVSDCGYSTLKDQLYHNFEQRHIPASAAYRLYRTAAKLHADFDPDECNPIEGVEKSNIPIIFAHGERDDFVPFDMVYANFDACPSPVKRLVTVPEAEHAQAFQIGDDLKEAILDMIGK
ncbi:MAG: alpha/beta hydrolase [Lachnospiraceae bacterium]|nr:alpha/beta hydrolase [Lachnospiraceae bacterium]